MYVNIFSKFFILPQQWLNLRDEIERLELIHHQQLKRSHAPQLFCQIITVIE